MFTKFFLPRVDRTRHTRYKMDQGPCFSGGQLLPLILVLHVRIVEEMQGAWVQGYVQHKQEQFSWHDCSVSEQLWLHSMHVRVLSAIVLICISTLPCTHVQ